MSRFQLVSRSARDLKGIRDWIEKDNPPRAVSYVADLMAHFQRLADRPLIGRARPEMGPSIRSMPHGRYLIFYRPTDQGVDIVRVIHGSRDLGRGIQ